jgi:hypothetical protein
MINMAVAKNTGWFKQSVRHSNARRFGRAGGTYADVGFRGQRKLDYLLKQHENGNILPYQEKELLELALARMEYNRTQLPKTPLFPRLPKKQQKELKTEWEKTKKWIKDTDKDGVPDAVDCKPNDPKKQGTNDQVVEAWAKYSQRDSSGSLESKGNTIYSYNTPIAIKLPDGTV